MSEYSLGQQCLSEFLGMATAIFLGECIIANEVLPRTKGHDLGFGFVALGFAFAFFLAIVSFGFISAHINPAMLMALAILGEIGWDDFVPLALSEVAGAFVGAVLVYIHYQPFFKTAPEPPAPTDAVNYIRRRDVYENGALNFSLTKEPVLVQPGIRGHITQVRDYMRDTHAYEDTLARFQLADALGQGMHELYTKGDAEQGGGGLRMRRRSVQVADLHKRIVKQQLFELEQPSFSVRQASTPPVPAPAHSDVANNFPQPPPSISAPGQQGGPGAKEGAVLAGVRVEDAEEQLRKAQEHVEAAFRSALEADKAAKLVIFATRPAIRSLINNFIQEFLGTFALIWGALLIDFQAGQVAPDVRPLFSFALKPFFLGLLIFVEILGLGGPTGFATNPARDFGPRLAHSVLPIPGKGRSEWGYAWIPVVAPLCGGAFAGLVHWGFEGIDRTAADVGFYGNVTG